MIAQCNLAWDFVSAPSKDPSPALPWWDKLRLILHGRLTLATQQLTLLLHTSLDPYSTTEEMELTWTDLVMDWTNADFLFKVRGPMFCDGGKATPKFPLRLLAVCFRATCTCTCARRPSTTTAVCCTCHG